MIEIERKVWEIKSNISWGFQTWHKKQQEVISEFDQKYARDWVCRISIEPKTPYEQITSFHALPYFIMWLERNGRCHYEIDGDSERWFRDYRSSEYGDVVVWESDNGSKRGIIKKTELKENKE